MHFWLDLCHSSILGISASYHVPNFSEYLVIDILQLPCGKFFFLLASFFSSFLYLGLVIKLEA